MFMFIITEDPVKKNTEDPVKKNGAKFWSCTGTEELRIEV
jgi:hypothetical protein